MLLFVCVWFVSFVACLVSSVILGILKTKYRPQDVLSLLRKTHHHIPNFSIPLVTSCPLITLCPTLVTILPLLATTVLFLIIQETPCCQIHTPRPFHMSHLISFSPGNSRLLQPNSCNDPLRTSSSYFLLQRNHPQPSQYLSHLMCR